MIVDNVVVETVERRDRNRRIEISCELERGMNYQIRCQREVVLIKDGKRVVTTLGANGQKNYTVQKNLSDIAADTVTLPAEAGGVTLTGAQIALAVEMLSDKYAQPNTGA